MNTSFKARGLLTRFAPMLLASWATAATASAGMALPVELRSGGHVEVVSAYLRASPQAVVRGFVRREALWRGPVGGHLHIVAYDADGRVIAQRAATWSGRFTSPHSPAAIYQADLAVPRTQVARLAVSVAAGRHNKSEPSQ